MDTKNKVGWYALAYALWAVSLAGAIWAGLLTRQALVNSVSVASLSRAKESAHAAFYIDLQIRAGDVWSYLVLGLVMVVVVVFLENYYRSAVPSGRLLARFLLVTTVTIGVLCAASTASTSCWPRSRGSAPGLT